MVSKMGWPLTLLMPSEGTDELTGRENYSVCFDHLPNREYTF